MSASAAPPPTAKPVAVASDDPTLTFSNACVQKARDTVKNGSEKVYRIYTDGIFDLFHLGHMNVLKQAKHALGDPARVHLIVGVCSDADTKQLKGLTVMDENTRAASVAHCKWADSVICPAPWILDEAFLTRHEIDFVAHDAAPYASADGSDCYALVKQKGMFLATDRTDGISTSDIIVQIVKDYDQYVDRNLARGFDRRTLNVGRTWEIRAVAHEKSRRVDASLEAVSAAKSELAQHWQSFVGSTKHSVEKLKRRVDTVVGRVRRGKRPGAGAGAGAGTGEDTDGDWSDASSIGSATGSATGSAAAAAAANGDDDGDDGYCSSSSSSSHSHSSSNAGRSSVRARPVSAAAATADGKRQSMSVSPARPRSVVAPSGGSASAARAGAAEPVSALPHSQSLALPSLSSTSLAPVSTTPLGRAAEPASTSSSAQGSMPTSGSASAAAPVSVTASAASAAEAPVTDVDDTAGEFADGSLTREFVAVVRHSGRLCWAVLAVILSILSYLNLLSYINKCKQTKRF